MAQAKCSTCWGSGKVSCGLCGGSGRGSDNSSACPNCFYSGRQNCAKCWGNGTVFVADKPVKTAQQPQGETGCAVVLVAMLAPFVGVAAYMLA